MQAIDLARRHVEPLFSALTPPLPQAAYATGGSARALAKLVGPHLGAGGARRRAADRRRAAVAEAGEDVRALSVARRTLAAGTLLLVCTQRLLGVPLEVARAGLREGVALSLFAEAAVAA